MYKRVLCVKLFRLHFAAVLYLGQTGVQDTASAIIVTAMFAQY